MKLIHLSDLHLGKRVNEFSMLEDQEYILKEIVQIVQEQQPDAVLISGDIYDRAVPPTEAVILFDDFLVRLLECRSASDRQVQVFVISGNHDSAERIAFGGRIMQHQGVHMAPVYNGHVEPITLQDEYGNVNIYMLPFIKPANVRRYLDINGNPVKAVPAESSPAHDKAVGLQSIESKAAASSSEAQLPVSLSASSTFSISLSGSADSEMSSSVDMFPDPEEGKTSLPQTYTEAVLAALRQMHVDPASRNILMTHQFVIGARRSDSEEISVGGTDSVSADIFDDFDYVALGHLHRPQNVGSPRIRYCGTPLKYSFSEADDCKSVTVVCLGDKINKMAEKETVAEKETGTETETETDLEAEEGTAWQERCALSVQTIPLHPLRDMRQIRGSYDDIMLRSSYSGTNCSDYMHITLTDVQDIPDAVNKLRIIYPNLMKMDYDNTRTRSDPEAAPRADEESSRKSPMELFEDFYQLQNGQPMNEEQKAYLLKIIESIWEDGE